jgi:hypothetical protein
MTVTNDLATLAGADVISNNGFLRNRIINGTTQIDQRNAGASQTITAGAALAYTVDRWYAYCTGANVTGQRVAGATTNTYRYQFTGAASVTAIGFAQRIESYNIADLAGSTVTLGVDLGNTLLTTVTWTAYYATTQDTFGTLASPTKTSIATGTFTVSSTISRYTTQITLPSGATSGVEIVFTVGAQTSGTWVIGNVQLEAGSTATPIERRPHGEQLLLCQRYCVKYLPSASGTYMYFPVAAAIDTSTTAQASIQFPVSLRSASATTLTTTGTAANYSLYSAGTVRALSVIPALVIVNNDGLGAQITLTVASGLTAGYSANFLGTNSATPYLLFSSEM